MFSNDHHFGPDRNVSTTFGWFVINSTEIALNMIPKSVLDPLIFLFQSSPIHLWLDWTVCESLWLWCFLNFAFCARSWGFTLACMPTWTNPTWHHTQVSWIVVLSLTVHTVLLLESPSITNYKSSDTTSALDRQIDLRASLQGGIVDRGGMRPSVNYPSWIILAFFTGGTTLLLQGIQATLVSCSTAVRHSMQ